VCGRRDRAAPPQHTLTGLEPHSRPANAIATEYDGPWGQARAVAVHPQALLVWVKQANGRWPEEAELQKILDQLSFGWATAHPRGTKSFLVPRMDEIGWRWVLTSECHRMISRSKGPLE